MDVGTSGGIRGWEQGYSLMIGGNLENFNQLEPIFKTLAANPESGYGLVGPSGAGHFIKMVHNGIEYGMMQAFAEGFEIIKAKSEFEFNLRIKTLLTTVKNGKKINQQSSKMIPGASGRGPGGVWGAFGSRVRKKN